MWSIHHVNLPAADMQASIRFYRDIIGLTDAAWTFPPSDTKGAVTADPETLVLFPAQAAPKGANGGLHLIRPQPDFARRNGMDHNPSIGGHVALQVPDLDAVMDRLKTAGIPYSYAGPYAIPHMRHIYVYDPGMNLLEINEFFG
jgi:catechol 2,3-dioxygenase-like lactoylglutathione lyase family enzyme